MAFVMIKNIAPDPVKIGFLSAVRIMLQANGISKRIEKFFGLGLALGWQKHLPEVVDNEEMEAIMKFRKGNTKCARGIYGSFP
jgi:hypothetical protein